jgi:hypothetical protein
MHVLPAEQSPRADVERAHAYLEELRADSLLHLFHAVPAP